ncbi:nucleolar protein Nop56, putative [Babesia bigemina]|uniref:Nucleolar protein 56 n=1 Tax=Babesia bigemina TaxID=5866 RepID=A0A061D9Y7_BABBI|nr:nucleolar protein Nop56, putative [Babesia bigemina]CDR94560.1 nucleolar protein Nop56, putative [Babesia bigemina]|eukprot:XP_012766746.1 nucleolar protein Nop56, putative [Babesia bigemina]
MTKTFFLFETAAGYALYQIEQWDQIGHVEAMEEVCSSEERFKETVKFKAFQPFTTASDALENIRAVVEGEVTAMLSSFLSLNLPKKGTQLAVVDPGLGKTLSAKGFNVVYDPNVVELLRGCRQHEMKNIARLASGASAFDMDKFHVGLSHNYSRSKLQIDPRRMDKPVINCVALLDSLTKNLNSFAMRVREWYGWHFPELIKIVPDNKIYCQVVQIICRKDKFDWEAGAAELLKVLGDEDIVANVKKAAGQSIGHELSEPCMENILNFAKQVVKLEEMREHLNTHLANKLAVTAPNLSEVAGNILTGRLISHAGSLVNLAKMSASSIQILGAEKALFRALKTRSNTPKYGLIFQANFIGRASLKHKGRAARYLANKCALAARLDCFCDVNTNVYGKRMVELLGKRMEYLAGGPQHETSIEVMQAAAKEYQAIKAQKASEKRTRDALENAPQHESAHDVSMVSGSADAEPADDASSGTVTEKPAKKSKKAKKDKSKKSDIAEEAATEDTADVAVASVAPQKEPKKKSKKSKAEGGASGKDSSSSATDASSTSVTATTAVAASKVEEANVAAAVTSAEEGPKKRKKSKQDKSADVAEAAEVGKPAKKAKKNKKKAASE